MVVSFAEINDVLRTVILKAMASKDFSAPFRMPVMHAGPKGLIVLSQLKTVDKVRFVKKLGAVSTQT